MTTTDQDKITTSRHSLPTTPLFAVVGATELAVQQVRAAAADMEKRIGEFDPKTLRSQAEAAYEELARRGKDLIDRVYPQGEGQPLVGQAFMSQAGNTLNRGRTAVTVARRAADDTASAIRGTLSLNRTTTERPEDEPRTADQVPVLDQETLERAVAVGDGADRVVAPTRKKAAPTTRKTPAATRKPASNGRRSTTARTPRANTKKTDEQQPPA